MSVRGPVPSAATALSPFYPETRLFALCARSGQRLCHARPGPARPERETDVPMQIRLAREHASAAGGSGQTTSVRLLTQLQHVRCGTSLSISSHLLLPSARPSMSKAHCSDALPPRPIYRSIRVLEAQGLLPEFSDDRCEGAAYSDTFADTRELVSHSDELDDAQARADGQRWRPRRGRSGAGAPEGALAHPPAEGFFCCQSQPRRLQRLALLQLATAAKWVLPAACRRAPTPLLLARRTLSKYWKRCWLQRC